MLVRISCSSCSHYGITPRSPLPRMLRCPRCGTVSLFRTGAAELSSRYELEMDSSSIPDLIERFSVPRESQSSSLLPKGIVATPFFTNPTLVASPTSDLQEAAKITDHDAAHSLVILLPGKETAKSGSR